MIRGHSSICHCSECSFPLGFVTGTIRARMHHKVVGNFRSEADVRSLYYRRFRFNETSELRCIYSRSTGEVNFNSFVLATSKMNPTSEPMHTKFERLLWKSLTTLEVMTYYLVVHTGPRCGIGTPCAACWDVEQRGNNKTLNNGCVALLIYCLAHRYHPHVSLPRTASVV